MPKNSLKRCSTILAIQKMPVKTALIFHLTSLRIAITKNKNKSKTTQPWKQILGSMSGKEEVWLGTGKIAKRCGHYEISVEKPQEAKTISTIGASYTILRNRILSPEGSKFYSVESFSSIFKIVRKMKQPKWPIN